MSIEEADIARCPRIALYIEVTRVVKALEYVPDWASV